MALGTPARGAMPLRGRVLGKIPNVPVDAGLIRDVGLFFSLYFMRAVHRANHTAVCVEDVQRRRPLLRRALIEIDDRSLWRIIAGELRVDPRIVGVVVILVGDPWRVEHRPGALRVAELLDGVDVVENPSVAPVRRDHQVVELGLNADVTYGGRWQIDRKSCQRAPLSREIQRPFSVPA